MGLSNAKRQKQRQLANYRFSIRTLNMWDDIAQEFDSFSLGNPKGRSRTFEENKLVLLCLKMTINQCLARVRDKEISIQIISRSYLKALVANGLQMRLDHVSCLRKQLFEDGDVLVFGEEHGIHSTRGNRSPNAKPTTKYDQ
jgi:hypothetical protein